MKRLRAMIKDDESGRRREIKDEMFSRGEPSQNAILITTKTITGGRRRGRYDKNGGRGSSMREIVRGRFSNGQVRARRVGGRSSGCKCGRSKDEVIFSIGDSGSKKEGRDTRRGDKRGRTRGAG